MSADEINILQMDNIPTAQALCGKEAYEGLKALLLDRCEIRKKLAAVKAAIESCDLKASAFEYPYNFKNTVKKIAEIVK